MAAIVNSIYTVVITVLLVVAAAPYSKAVIGCGRVVSYVQSCLPYVTNKGPIGSCCDGIKGLYAAAKTTPDRQSVCGCLKTLAASSSDIDLGKAEALPGQCGVNIPYKISPSTDCSKVT